MAVHESCRFHCFPHLTLHCRNSRTRTGDLLVNSSLSLLLTQICALIKSTADVSQRHIMSKTFGHPYQVFKTTVFTIWTKNVCWFPALKTVWRNVSNTGYQTNIPWKWFFVLTYHRFNRIAMNYLQKNVWWSNTSYMLHHHLSIITGQVENYIINF